MVVLDTHVWLWWASDPDRLSTRARATIEANDKLAVSAMSCWEVASLARRERISLDRDTELWIRNALAHPALELVRVGANIATAAGLLSESFPGDPGDRIIYASARHARSVLVTADRAIRAFDPPGTVW